MRCPHCNKIIKDDRVETAKSNAENYGSSSFVLDCLKCGKYYDIYIERYIKMVGKPEKSERLISDF